MKRCFIGQRILNSVDILKVLIKSTIKSLPSRGLRRLNLSTLLLNINELPFKSNYLPNNFIAFGNYNRILLLNDTIVESKRKAWIKTPPVRKSNLQITSYAQYGLQLDPCLRVTPIPSTFSGLSNLRFIEFPTQNRLNPTFL